MKMHKWSDVKAERFSPAEMEEIQKEALRDLPDPDQESTGAPPEASAVPTAPAASDLDAIIRRGGNPTAKAELERLRRVQRWACALVESWKHGGPDDLQRGRISAALAAAVDALMGTEGR
ncbi:MAG: hypothetical protein ABI560_00445 [Myxococcales bacterium]